MSRADLEDADLENAGWIARDLRSVSHPEPPGDERLVLVGGDGCTLVGADGTEYLDAHAAAWLVQVGYGRTEIADAVQRRLAEFGHFSLLLGVSTPPAIALAERLVALTAEGTGKVRFCSTGSEADDEAVQIVRFYHDAKGHPERRVILTLEHCYHGHTVAGYGLAATPLGGMPDPLGGAVVQVPAPHPYRNGCPAGLDLTDWAVDELERVIAETGPERIAALFGEPVQGLAGMVPFPDDYWPRVEEVLRRHGILFVMDEVVTGIGRTGSWLASTRYGVRPDVILLAKGLASGYMPIGALLLTDDVAETVSALRSAGSFSGHAAACAAALANLDIIQREGLLENARERGDQFLRELAPLLEHDLVGHVHGAGLMVGVDLVTDKDSRTPLAVADEELTLAIRHDYGVILHVVNGTVIITPPLVITAEEVTRVVEAVRRAVERLRPDGTLRPLDDRRAGRPAAGPVSSRS